ncbi:MAG: hypothetical protein AAFX99_16715, partial [Myxococcota bacterium]
KGDTARYDKAMADIATREKEMGENAKRRVKDAEVMGKTAKLLLVSECAAIASALSIQGASPQLVGEVNTFKSQLTCP